MHKNPSNKVCVPHRPPPSWSNSGSNRSSSNNSSSSLLYRVVCTSNKMRTKLKRNLNRKKSKIFLLTSITKAPTKIQKCKIKNKSYTIYTTYLFHTACTKYVKIYTLSTWKQSETLGESHVNRALLRLYSYWKLAKIAWIRSIDILSSLLVH